jgi:hypothetical protein
MALLPLAARSATRAQLGPDVCAARSRHVSAALRARLLTWCALCFGTARLALGALVYPPPPPVHSMRSDRVIYINKWKLNLEIDYVSYFM